MFPALRKFFHKVQKLAGRSLCPPFRYRFIPDNNFVLSGTPSAGLPALTQKKIVGSKPTTTIPVYTGCHSRACGMSFPCMQNVIPVLDTGISFYKIKLKLNYKRFRWNQFCRIKIYRRRIKCVQIS